MKDLRFRVWLDSEYIYSNDGTLEEFFARYESLGEIEQYIGLKDKNGVDIYEGDILKGLCGNEVIVDFRFGMFFGVGINDDFDFMDYDTSEYFEVVGNYHKGVS